MTTKDIALSDAQVHETVLGPRTGWRGLGLRDLWAPSSHGVSRLIVHAGTEPRARRSEWQ